MTKTKVVFFVLALITVVSLCFSVSAETTANLTIIVEDDIIPGETVTATVCLTGANVKGMSINPTYNKDVLEIQSAEWMDFEAPIKVDWTADDGAIMAFDKARDLSNEAVLVMTFRVKEDAVINADCEIGCDISIAFMVDGIETRYNSVDNPDMIVVTPSNATGGSALDSSPDYVITDKITVFEATALYKSVGKNQPLVTVTKGASSYDLITVYNTTKELAVKVGNSDYFLYDSNANKLLLDETTPTNIALVYDDVKGTLRCYVNGSVAYYYTSKESRHLVNDITVDTTFVSATGDETVTGGEGVSLNAVYNIGDSGTSEVVAFQKHNQEDAIRILAGVDMPWYETVGFEFEIYKDGVGQGVEIRTSQTIFESIVSNSTPVKAEDYGHKFFATCVIKGVDVSKGSVYYINVKPFTKVGATIYYGTLVKINVDANGDYTFAK